MTDWWEVPYKGGPMVAVDGFPRPMYPPDDEASPSGDGPDVIAYKRTLCRLGRWGDWDPNQWDNSYSNAFAHGRGPNVKDTGIAGFQRQMNIDPTGNIGTATFNALRSARVPEGPHEGEMGMDAYAANLINQAYAEFNQPPPPTKTLQERILAEMKELVGYHEQPAGSNHVPGITDWYGMDRQPWCAMTVTKAGVAAGSIAFVKGERYAYCPYVYEAAAAGGYGMRLVSQGAVIPGNAVLFDWDFDGVWDHIGVFVKWIDPGYKFQSIEGNIDSRCDYHTRTVGAQGLAFVHFTK